ncbi:MAG: hypothetical protein WAV09_02430 [Minisyncoccia bacterium]
MSYYPRFIGGVEVGGTPDFLFDPETHRNKATGLFCEIESPESIVVCVERLMRDKSLYRELSSNGSGLVKERYS